MCGTKRHFLVDVIGIPFHIVVTDANVQDRDGLPILLKNIRKRHKRLKHIWIDQGYHGPRTSLIGGYRDGKLIAPVLFNGNCNTEITNVWLKDHLLPELRPGSVIVIDNAAFHKSQETRDIIAVSLYFLN